MGWRIKHGVGDMNAIEAGGGKGGEIGDEGYAQQNQNFARYGIGGEISITLLVFILDYFQDKLMAKFFKQSKKKTILGQFWALEKGLKYSNYLPLCQKSQKNNE